MSKKKAFKWLWLAALGAMTIATGVACGGKDGEGKKPQFLEGIDTELELGDGMDLSDYIDYVTDGEYVITVSDGKTTEDITKKRYWEPSYPGTYTFTYKVLDGEYEGENSFTVVVNVPLMTWKYTLSNTIYDTGYTLGFDEYFNKMNISAMSYYPWKMVMDSVSVGDVTTEITDQTAWTFQTAEPHVFKFHIESEDGQSYSLSQSVRVRYVEEEMLAFMDANDITAEGALRLENEQKVLLQEGDHRGAVTTHIDQCPDRTLPYVAFNGEYGINDFLVFDFTGTNMPSMVFFADKLNDTVWNNGGAAEYNKGFVISGGWTQKNGQPFAGWQTETSINARFKIYGPNKIVKTDDDRDGQIRTMFDERPNMLSLYNLWKEENANRKYRVFIGFTSFTETEFTVEVCVMDLGLGDIIYSASKTVKNTQIKGNNDGSVVFTEDMFKGKIGLYGTFGKTTQLDKIYAIEQDTSIQELAVKYFETPYKWMKAQKVTGAGIVSSNERQEVVLGAIVYEHITSEGIDDTASVPAEYCKTNMSYIAFNGNYGLNDFLVLDFTGNNMPYISFFNNAANNTIFNKYDNTIKKDESGKVIEEIFNEKAKEEKGLVIANGQLNMSGEAFAPWNKSGSVNDRITLAGPWKANKFGASDLGWFRDNIAGAGTPMGIYTLSKAENANTKYRMFVGFTQGDTTGCTIVMHVINRDTNAVVCSYNTRINETFPENYFTGSIALHGQFGKQTSFKVSLHEDTTLENLIIEYTVVPV